MTSRECADRENGIGLCTRGPVRPDICFGKCCGWSMASVCVRMCVCVCVEAKTALQLLLLHIYPLMFIEVDEGECVGAGKTAAAFLPLQSLPSLTDNGITHQRGFSLYPILLRPLPAFVHIHHDNSPDPNLHQQASPCFLSPSGERLNLDENEIFICTQQLMAILIWSNFWCNISPHCCLPSTLFIQMSSPSLSLPATPSSCGWFSIQALLWVWLC